MGYSGLELFAALAFWEHFVLLLWGKPSRTQSSPNLLTSAAPKFTTLNSSGWALIKWVLSGSMSLTGFYEWRHCWRLQDAKHECLNGNVLSEWAFLFKILYILSEVWVWGPKKMCLKRSLFLGTDVLARLLLSFCFPLLFLYFCIAIPFLLKPHIIHIIDNLDMARLKRALAFRGLWALPPLKPESWDSSNRRLFRHQDKQDARGISSASSLRGLLWKTVSQTSWLLLRHRTMASRQPITKKSHPMCFFWFVSVPFIALLWSFWVSLWVWVSADMWWKWWVKLFFAARKFNFPSKACRNSLILTCFENFGVTCDVLHMGANLACNPMPYSGVYLSSIADPPQLLGWSQSCTAHLHSTNPTARRCEDCLAFHLGKRLENSPPSSAALGLPLSSSPISSSTLTLSPSLRPQRNQRGCETRYYTCTLLKNSAARCVLATHLSAPMGHPYCSFQGGIHG